MWDYKIKGGKMEELKPMLDLYGDENNLGFEAQILEKSDRVADLLIKKGYKIKKPVWKGLIAS